MAREARSGIFRGHASDVEPVKSKGKSSVALSHSPRQHHPNHETFNLACPANCLCGQLTRRRVTHFRRSNFDTVSARMFRGIQGRIHFIEQVLYRLPAPLLTEQKPDAHGDGNWTCESIYRARSERLSNVFCSKEGVSGVAIVQSHQNFLAPVAPHEVVRPYGR